ncbi:MAG: N-acetylmuramoyl-L-alanine amidase [Solirubrobacteraceae bacterium]|nr:N-acetylmuramoyl-L-alanine amidase [Solirubrobacteraceae bacterium]
MRRQIPSLAATLGAAVLAATAGLTAAPAEPTVATTVVEARPLDGKIVHLDAGHNGGNASAPSTINALVDAGGGVRKACDTTGTETNDRKLTEAAFNLDVAQRLERLLERRGATVVMTRRSNRGVGPCITRRAAIGNEAGADAAVSIHADGGPATGRGFHVIRPKGVSGQDRAMLDASDRLGRRIRTALRAKGYRPATYIARQGLDLRDDLGGLNLSEVPKVFAELGNMRNAADARLLKSTRHRERMAEALADALTTQLTS